MSSISLEGFHPLLLASGFFIIFLSVGISFSMGMVRRVYCVVPFVMTLYIMLPLGNEFSGGLLFLFDYEWSLGLCFFPSLGGCCLGLSTSSYRLVYQVAFSSLGDNNYETLL